MKSKIIISVIGLTLLTGEAYCQTREEIEAYRQQQEEIIAQQEAKIRAFHECFFNLQSRQAVGRETYRLSSGKVVNALARSDYERSVFVSADETLKDVLLWKESPYLWRLRHYKPGGKALLDAKDLSKWEVDGFGMIADQYFEDSPSTFHIGSHGLLAPDGTAAGMIKIGGVELNAEETAELIIQSMRVKTENGDAPFEAIINAEHQNFVIVVHCCHTAEGENNFAQQLSVELAKYLDNVTVVGAPELVNVTLDENGNYQECVTSREEYEKAKRSNYQYKPRELNWKAYKNGQDSGQGMKDYHSTVQAIQGAK